MRPADEGSICGTMTSATHPLDRAVWNALTGPQADRALGGARAWRLDPRHGLFAAAADRSDESLAALAALVRDHGDAAWFEPGEPPVLDGVTIARSAVCLQMTAERPVEAGSAPSFEIIDLTDADAPDMLALATLTEPGPFFSRTHRLGDFVGVREDGVLIAMAGERLRPRGFTEVSAVCTRPEQRGRGLAGALMRVVARRIQARGDTPFLHSYATNAGAIGLYEHLGFATRREVTVAFLTRA